MNFFNFKRKHWVMVGIFTGAMLAMVAGFAYFMERQSQKVIAEVRGYLVPEQFQLSVDEEKDLANDDMDDNFLSVQAGGPARVPKKDSCTSCAQKLDLTPEILDPAVQDQ